MTTPSANQTVREIAVDNPETVRVFESLGIDYCCGAGHSLQEACAAVGVPVEEAVQKLTAAPPAVVPEDMDQWREATLHAIASHILDRHHGFVRRETTRLKELFEKVRNRH